MTDYLINMNWHFLLFEFMVSTALRIPGASRLRFSGFGGHGVEQALNPKYTDA
jgi:hypothetical protein